MRTSRIQCGAAILMLWSAFATAGPNPPDVQNLRLADLIPEGRETCLYGRETPIPDADPAGVTLGPISLPASQVPIDGLCLALDIEHEFIADLRIELAYDLDRDGSCEITVPLELSTLRAGSHEAEAELAYPFCLDGVYFFRDDAGVREPSPVAMNGVGQSCSTGRPISDFVVFQGQSTGGDFYLTVADTLATRRGVLRDWAVGQPQ